MNLPFFAVKAYVPGGVQNQAEKNSKNAFRPVPVQKLTFPDVGPGTTQNLVVKFDGEICGGVLVENASDDFPQQKKLENLLPNFAGSWPPISPKTSPTSLWKSLVLMHGPTSHQYGCFSFFLAKSYGQFEDQIFTPTPKPRIP